MENFKTGEAGSKQNSPPRKSKRSKIIIGVVALLIALGIVWAITGRKSADAKKQGGGKANAFPVPVIAGVAAKKDMPIYLDGLGTVQAFNTVTVRVRVDGQLQKVAFTEGQDVKAGDVLVQIDPDPFKAQLNEAEAKKHQDEAQLANARLQLERDTDLLKQKIVAQQDYDTQKSTVDQLEALVRADQAGVESAKVQLNYTTVVSPIDGRTGLRMVDAGNIVKANDATGVVVITQLRPISVIFTIPEQNLGEIHQQMAAGTLSVLAVGRDNRTVLGEGTLAVVDNQLDTTTATIRLKATFPNQELRLWPGQFVNTRLLLKVHKDAVTVPASVVQRGQEGAYAFVIKEDSTVQIRPVKVAQIEDGEALIEAGLLGGEKVVVDGQYKLQNGSKVKISSGEEMKPGGARKGGTNNPAGSNKNKKQQ